MASRNLSAKQPAKNIGSGAPSRKVMGPNGVMVTEKLSPLWGKKMVHPDGDVTVVTLSTGYTIRGLKNNSHGLQKLEEKLKQGFLVFSECPVATRRVSDMGEPCKGTFSDEECCPHIKKIIQDRRAHHRAGQLEYGKSFASQTDRLIDFVQKQASDVVERTEKKARIGG